MMILFFLAGVLVFGAVYRFLNYRAAGYGRNTVLFSICILIAEDERVIARRLDRMAREILGERAGSVTVKESLANRAYHALQYLGYMVMMGATPLC